MPLFVVGSISGNTVAIRVRNRNLAVSNDNEYERACNIADTIVANGRSDAMRVFDAPNDTAAKSALNNTALYVVVQT